MLYYRRSRCRPVSLALVGLFVWLTGCTSYTQIQPGEVADHDHIRVTQTDGTQRDFYHAVVEADSIKGQRHERPASRHYEEPVYAIPLDQVSMLESAHGDAGKTVGVVALVLVGTFAVLFGIVLICCLFSARRDEDRLHDRPRRELRGLPHELSRHPAQEPDQQPGYRHRSCLESLTAR